MNDTLDDLIVLANKSGRKLLAEKLAELREKLCNIYEQIESTQDVMSMCADAPTYEAYVNASNQLYDILYS